MGMESRLTCRGSARNSHCGNPSNIEDLRRDAQMLPQEGLESVRSVLSLVDRIKSRMASVKTFEVCTFSSRVGSFILTCHAKVFFKQMALRHDCLRYLRAIVAIIDTALFFIYNLPDVGRSTFDEDRRF